jgi:hypothetical protein
VEIGYSLQNVETHINYHMKIKGIDYIGDYYCIFDRHPAFYYCTTSDEVHAFALKKEHLKTCLDAHPGLKSKILNNSFKKYIETIKNKIEKHISLNLKIYNQTHNEVKINRKLEIINVSDYLPSLIWKKRRKKRI